MRRGFLVGLSSSALWAVLRSSPLLAQSSLPRVAYVLNGSRINAPKGVEAFLAQMRQLGWIEGRNVVIDVRETGPRPEGVAAAIADSLQSQPAVIVVGGSVAVKAAYAATRSVPIVASSIGDPVEQGYARSLAHPGGNVTGNALVQSVSQQKTIELMKSVLPSATRIAMLINPTNPLTPRAKKQSDEAAAKQGFEILYVDAASREDFPAVFAKLPAMRVDGLILANEALFISEQQFIVDLLSPHRIPVVYPSSDFVDKGGLMSYSLSYEWLYTNAAKVVDRILRGQKPSEMPFEQPSHFELAVNLRTAKALGLQVPREIVLRADKVVQ